MDHYSIIVDRLVENVQTLKGMLDDGTLVLVKKLDETACAQARDRVVRIRDLARQLQRHETGGVIPEARMDLYEKLAGDTTPAALCSDVIGARAMISTYTDKLLRMAEADMARTMALGGDRDRRIRVAVAGDLKLEMCHVGPFDDVLPAGGTVPVRPGTVIIHHGTPATVETLGDMSSARLYELRGGIVPRILEVGYKIVQHGSVTGSPSDIIAEAERVWGGGYLFIDSGDGRVVVQTPPMTGAFEWIQSVLMVDKFTVKYLDREGIRSVVSGGSGRKLHVGANQLKAWLAKNPKLGKFVHEYTDIDKGTVHVPANAPDEARRAVMHLILWGIRLNHIQDPADFKWMFGSKKLDRVDLDKVTGYVWGEFSRLLYLNETMNIMRYRLRGRQDEPFLLTPSAYATGGQQGYGKDRFITSPNGRATGLRLPPDAKYIVVVPGDNCPALQFAESLVY